jgi:hypothetical protein
MTAKLGRPKLEVTRTVLIGARFTPEEAGQIDVAVARSGRVKSDWLREVLLAAARETRSQSATPVSSQTVFEQASEFLD